MRRLILMYVSEMCASLHQSVCVHGRLPCLWHIHQRHLLLLFALSRTHNLCCCSSTPPCVVPVPGQRGTVLGTWGGGGGGGCGVSGGGSACRIRFICLLEGSEDAGGGGGPAARFRGGEAPLKRPPYALRTQLQHGLSPEVVALYQLLHTVGEAAAPLWGCGGRMVCGWGVWICVWVCLVLQ